MVLHPQSIKPIPPLTRQIAQQAFPKGNLYMNLRDELGTFYHDEDFSELYSTEGQPALRPWHLALICVMQYIANLSDRGAVEAVAARHVVVEHEHVGGVVAQRAQGLGAREDVDEDDLGALVGGRVVLVVLCVV